jgi:3-methyl-2-oxobutanoate hydroxymethyltransferase
MPKLTVYDIRQLKGKGQLAQVFVGSEEEAAACEAAGIDMMCTMSGLTSACRRAAPNVFIIAAVGGTSASNADAIRAGEAALGQGADAVYTGSSTKRVKAMSREFIPVVGHVGLVPYRNTFVGGMRAVGKTADEAMQVYEDTKRYEDAGAFGVEMEVVPHQIATEISRRTSMCVISMGAGTGCDVQYLFSCDVLGTHDGHYPRHAKKYRDLHTQMQGLQQERIAGYKEYAHEVHNGAYPEPGQIVEAKPDELEKFKKMLGTD